MSPARGMSACDALRVPVPGLFPDPRGCFHAPAHPFRMPPQPQPRRQGPNLFRLLPPVDQKRTCEGCRRKFNVNVNVKNGLGQCGNQLSVAAVQQA